jgi:nicotinate-nucleotide pyrophosphorylase (carboxylating)
MVKKKVKSKAVKKTTRKKAVKNKKSPIVKKKVIKKPVKKIVKKKAKKTSKTKSKKLKFSPKVDDSIKNADHLIELALKEDLGKDLAKGDITSIATIPKTKRVKAQIRVKEHCVLCGVDLAQKIIEVYEKLAKIKAKDKVKFEILMRDGAFLQKNEVAMKFEGPAITILTCERTMLNIVSRLSGISTSTNRFVTKLIMHGVQLLDTRKTLGGYRELEKYAVRVGGGTNHRTGLYDMFLIKDNHVQIAGSIKKAMDAAIKKRGKKDTQIELEVESLKQVNELLKLKKLPNIVMLDNLSYEEMEISVDRIRKKSKLAKKNIKIEASGGVTIENITEVAKCGVDMISVGSALTLGAKPVDFTLDIID